jgi:hypothetical protein
MSYVLHGYSDKTWNPMKTLEQFRIFNNERLPSWYHWTLQVLANVSLLVFFSWLPLHLLPAQDYSGYIWLVAFLMAWSILEYGIHRFVLHGQLFSKLQFKVQHSHFHHNYFTDKFIEIQQLIDLNRVFLYSTDLLAVLVLNAFLSFFIYLFVDSQLSLLFFLAGVIYASVYEMVHAICHSTLDKKNPCLKWIMKHHRIHHNLKFMNTKNFSVVVPFLDTLFGTKEISESVDKAFSWQTVKKESDLGQKFAEQSRKAFGNLSDDELTVPTVDIGVFHLGELVGGFSLIEFGDISKDPRVNRYWLSVGDPKSGTRLSRLWTKQGAPRTTLPNVFKTLTEVVNENTFLYGVLSLPLGFALKRLHLFLEHEDRLSPRKPIEDCDWDPNARASSEGRKLLQFYYDAGAKFLGPPSGSQEDKSIRVAIGMKLFEVKSEKRANVYAKSNLEMVRL